MDEYLLERLLAGEVTGTTKTVYDYMARNYPRNVLGFVATGHWKLQTVRLKDIQYARRVGGARDDDKTVGIAEAIKGGKKMQPMVLVEDGSIYKVADGYHRALAFDRLGVKTVQAWVGTGIKDFNGPKLHAAKQNTGLKAATDIPDSADPAISPIDFGQPQNDAFPGERFPQSKITINTLTGSRELNVGLATTPTQRALGLSNLPDAGYSTAALLLSWPYDKTLASLSNAQVPVGIHATFFDSAGKYVDHQVMTANQTQPITARSPHKHVLEVPEDAADALGLGPGSSFDLGHDDDDGTPFE